LAPVIGRKRYRTVVEALPGLVENRHFDRIEQLLVGCGSFQVASNFKDIVNILLTYRDELSKIVEIGTFNSLRRR
jgi:hypothetical protein